MQVAEIASQLVPTNSSYKRQVTYFKPARACPWYIRQRTRSNNQL